MRRGAMCRSRINSMLWRSAPLFEFCRSTWCNLWLRSKWQENKRGWEYSIRAILHAIGQKRVSWDTDHKVQPRLDWWWNFVSRRRVRMRMSTWIQCNDELSGKERENVMVDVDMRYVAHVVRSTDLFDEAISKRSVSPFLLFSFVPVSSLVRKSVVSFQSWCGRNEPSLDWFQSFRPSAHWDP